MTGEIRELKLTNGNGEAEQFYRTLSSPVLVGLEACGNTQWFEDMLERSGHEVWIGDAAEIRASYVHSKRRTSSITRFLRCCLAVACDAQNL